MTSLKVWRTAAFVAVAALLSTAAARADFGDKKPITYTLDGGTATGYFKVVAEALNGVVREVYPGSAATYKPGSPAGGIQNIALGQSDISANAGAPEIIHAIEGKPPFKESLKGKFSFVMMLHNDLIVHSVMTKEWADRNGIKSYADIAAKKPQMRLAVNTLANLQSTLSMYIAFFGAYGIDEGQVTDGGKAIFRGNSASGFDALRDGKIDVFINGGFVPTAELTDIARGRQLVWISASPAKAKEVAERWGNTPKTVAKGAYPFVTQDEMSTTQWSAAVAGAHVSDETIYKLLKALVDNKDRVRSIHPSLAEFSAEAAAKNRTPLPFHSGAAKYYREAGVLK